MGNFCFHSPDPNNTVKMTYASLEWKKIHVPLSLPWRFWYTPTKMDTWTQWRSCLVHIELSICWGKKNFLVHITWLVGFYFSNWWLILCPLQWNHRVLTTGPPGESPKRFLKALFPCIKKLSECSYFPMWNHVIMLNKLFQMSPIPWRHQYVGTEVSVYQLLSSHSVTSNSLQPHGLQHARLPCP